MPLSAIYGAVCARAPLRLFVASGPFDAPAMPGHRRRKLDRRGHGQNPAGVLAGRTVGGTRFQAGSGDARLRRLVPRARGWFKPPTIRMWSAMKPSCWRAAAVFPSAIGRNRPAAAQLLINAGCDVIVSDDGLQHYALQRDCEIVVIDGDRRFGNGRLLPAGPLREAPARLQACGRHRAERRRCTERRRACACDCWLPARSR